MQGAPRPDEAHPIAPAITDVRIHRPILLGFQIALGMCLFGLLSFAIVCALVLLLPFGGLGLVLLALKAMLFPSKWW